MANYKGLHLTVKINGEIKSAVGTGKGSVVALLKNNTGSFDVKEISLKEFSGGVKIFSSIEPKRIFTRQETVEKALNLAENKVTLNSNEELIQHCFYGVKKTNKEKPSKEKLVRSNISPALFTLASVITAAFIGYVIKKYYCD